MKIETIISKLQEERIFEKAAIEELKKRELSDYSHAVSMIKHIYDIFNICLESKMPVINVDKTCYLITDKDIIMNNNFKHLYNENDVAISLSIIVKILKKQNKHTNVEYQEFYHDHGIYVIVR